ncbi:DUF309 domain-containing protein [Crocosphaera sp. XPORK-15E]|uniref:DUF309 domain-containing protein n=1 Tax=Crocosphaera sp. XPORK-15E TaxID=3110247 RepID=UPI002B2168EA|nr:DUF309 domain-containing protein [Crocosphaera sp. XPORK-15E]MEA5533518.1 DUF309 domain-containing protein [Crocosphaera sp. XPORK-15E]
MASDAFLQGIKQFNQGEFYACHDTLEAIWLEAAELDKRFYQGVLQVAVGCYHLENHNWRGAVILLGEGVRRLVDYQPEYETIDVTKLLEESQALLLYLQQTDPEKIVEVAKTLKESSENAPCSLPHIVILQTL